MFTMFHGFHLVEEYHQWKKEHRNNRNPIGVKAVKLLLAVAIPLFFWISPSSILRISTPPNALADATGFIQQKYMVKTGLIVGLVGLLLGYLMLIFCGTNGVF